MRARRFVTGGLLLEAMACSLAPSEPLQLNRNLLTVDNQSNNERRNVEILKKDFQGSLPNEALGGK